ncbi:MAG TPA: TadE/TadG family type IV pilus assembly protein [Candidatus Acidoferrales bacterium]|nr:TadE/TadG family type IV pilus assembly protein [Candidatus Acidoferrales bacterium]
MKKVANWRVRGQAIIEFTLTLPLIVMILAGLTDLGLVFFFTMSLQNAVREGARIAAITPGLGANDSTIAAAVTSRMPPGTMFTLTSVSNTAPSGGTTDCGRTVTVTATGTYDYMFLQIAGFTTVDITRSTTMRYEPTTELCMTLTCSCS